MSVRTSSAVVVHVVSQGAHPADWEVLEPSSSVLQTDARVSQEENTGVSATSPWEALSDKVQGVSKE